MKHVLTCLSASEDRECSFSPLWKTCEARPSLFRYQERTRMLVSRHWNYRNTCASLFMCVKGLIKRF